MSLRAPSTRPRRAAPNWSSSPSSSPKAHHGYEIAKLIEQRTGGTLRFTLASLYSTLYRLEDRGWLKGRWVEKAGQRRRCYYRITECRAARARRAA